MASVQERLKLKRAQIDTWSTREKLCLASAVLRSGDQNWMSVSRSLKVFGDPGRPGDWFSQKSCAVQYSSLLENVETPKRKKRTDKGDTVETPSESIVRRLTQERIEELKRLMNEDRIIYAKLKEEVMQVKAGLADDRLPEMMQDIEEEKRQKEKKAEAHEQWLRDREEKKVELERAWKPPVAPASPLRRKPHNRNIHRRNSSQSEPSSEADSALDSPLSEPLNVDVIGEENVHEAPVEPKPPQTPTSPLLTSLLKSPSPAPSSQSSSILHSVITSNRGVSPTITSLLNSAPGIPGTGSTVSVAPPTTVSSSLKNLVSSAINSEQQHHQPPPHNPSPAAGAPTLSMLLELPPSLPGKPLPELPIATLPISTVSAVVPAAVPPATTSVAAKLMAPRTATTAAAPTLTTKMVAAVPAKSGSNEGQAAVQEIKTSTSMTHIEDMEVVHVESSPDASQNLSGEDKEEPIEVLIEEVVVNDESVIESELLSSQVTDVVVSTEQLDASDKKKPTVDELKLDGQFIEVCHTSEVSSEKDKTKADDAVADADSSSSNSAVSLSVENALNTDAKNSKEAIEAIIENSSQDIVSEIVAEGSALEVVPASEAVAEVIEITDDQEGTIQSEVDHCMQELEDMEVIILDKMQGLDEVQIVEDMKELECEVVEVVMDSHQKVDEDVKEGREELAEESPKSDEVTAVETLEADAVECKDDEDTSKTLSEPEIVEVSESDIVEESNIESEPVARSEDTDDTESITIKSKENLRLANKAKGDKSEEPEESKVDKVERKETGKKEKEFHKEHSKNNSATSQSVGVSVGTSEVNGDKSTEKETQKGNEPRSTPVREVSKKEGKEYTRKDIIRESSRKESILRESLKKDTAKSESKKELREQKKEEAAAKESDVKEISVKETTKKEATNKEQGNKRDNVRETPKDTKEPLPARRESSKDVTRQASPLKDEEKKELAKEKKELKEKRDVSTKEFVSRSKEEARTAGKDSLKKESGKKVVKEMVRKDQSDKHIVKETSKEPLKRENVKKEVPPKESVKEVLTKDVRKVAVSKEKDAEPNLESKKAGPSKEVPKKDHPVKEGAKKEPVRRDSKEERKDIVKRSVLREEKKESPREDLRKRTHLKENLKGTLRKSEVERKNPEITKPETTVKGEKTRRESSEVVHTDTKESRREKGSSDLKPKTEDTKVKEEDKIAKDAKQTSTSALRATRAEGDKSSSDAEKKDAKETTKGSTDSKHHEVLEAGEEKVGKRTPLRAETPSTEDDKTNDAEPPKTVGRKRLTVVNLLDSVPNSPASASTTDEEKEYRAWKKSIMLLYGRLATHKYASLFLRPITDDQAPGYSSVVHRPIDLLTIKKNIETGVIRNTVEFQRDVMLMFLNSIMYNKSSHFVHKMAKQMQQEGMQHIQDFLTTQMLVQVVGDGVPIRRETRTTEANKQRDILGNPSGSNSQDEGESGVVHKRKRNVAGDTERGFKKKKVDD